MICKDIMVRTPWIVRKKWWKESTKTKPISAFYLYYDRSLLLFSRPMRDEDTSAFREMFQYSSWLWPSSRPNQILLILMDYCTWQFLVSLFLLPWMWSIFQPCLVMLFCQKLAKTVPFLGYIVLWEDWTVFSGRG